MQQYEYDTSAAMRQVVQVVCDLAQRPLSELRILDLGCAHGHYALEMARRGAQVVGIEGRKSWLEQARRAQQEAGLTNVSFVQDDVRHLSRETYGTFDVVLCLGILYHLDIPAAFDFLHSVFEVCSDFAVINTHFATRPSHTVTWRGNEYRGTFIQEHAADATAEEKLKSRGASLDNEASFWLSRMSLYNILQHVGFTSVYDCSVPLANVYVGPERLFKIWGNRTTLVAVKGQPVTVTGSEVADWPEDVDTYLLEQYLLEQQSPVMGKVKGGLRRLLRRFLSW